MQPVAVADAADVVAALATGTWGPGQLHRVFDLVGPEALSLRAFTQRVARRAGIRDYAVEELSEEEADRRSRAGGYPGMLPDELDCMLCDEIGEASPLEALLGRGLRPLDAVLINLNEQLLGMMDLLRRTLGATINLVSSLAPDLWLVRSDVSEIENAVLNLAINARDAMPHGGKLLIETSNLIVGDPPISEELGLPIGDYVRLSVSDTGHGIDDEILARVFEPFFTTKEAGRGTGLGLSVIYGFARQSGGRLTIYSEPKRGTTVNLYLPREQKERRDRPYEEGSVQPSTGAGEIILVVEDQASVRSVTAKRLEKLGYRVREAENAVEAKALLAAGEVVDFVFSDIVMPGGMTGFDLADWLHINRPEIPVLLTSGFAENIAQEFAKDRKAITVLRKPYSGDDLATAIRATLDSGEITCE